MNIDSLKSYLESRLPAYLRMLESWVGMNSFTANRDGVNALGEITAEAFAALGFSAERVPSDNAGFGDHFVLKRAGSGVDARAIGLVSHLDTVFPPEEEIANQFSWRLEGDRIYGPGTVDIKGGTLMIYMVLDALRAQQPEVLDAANWVILLDASEETMSRDFGALCRAELKNAAACLVFEGGFFEEDTFKLVQMRKGMAKFRVHSVGKAAHAGVAHADGVNAIAHLSKAITRIAALTDYGRNITFNIGYINGGTVPNRVPHFAEAVGEMRAFDDEIFELGVQELVALAGVSDDAGGAQVQVDVYERTTPWPRNERTDRLLAHWQDAGHSLGWRVLPEARGGLSDGNHTWDVVPTLDGLGPGGGNAHCSEHDPAVGKVQEYLYLPSLVPKAVLNCVAIAGLLKA